MNKQTDTADCNDISDQHTDEEKDTVECQYVRTLGKSVSKNYRAMLMSIVLTDFSLQEAPIQTLVCLGQTLLPESGGSRGSQGHLR